MSCLRERYAEGKSVYALAVEEGVSPKTVWKRLKKQGNVFRKPGMSPAKVDDSYFKYIDSPEKAYWLGVLYADGFVVKTKQGASRIGLVSVDEEWVRDFTKAVEFEGTISIVKNNWAGAFGVFIASKEMFGDLGRLGIVQNKSLIVVPPKIQFESAFWRGVVDGDGSIMQTRFDGYPQPCIKICSGSRATCDGFMDFIETHTGKRRKVFQTGTTWVAQVQGRDAITIGRILYEHKGSCLRRKHEKFLELCN